MSSNEKLKAIFSDIRFWIAFFFFLRMIGITNAPLEIGHNWRQALTSMIARNFYEGSADILYPRIDMAGDQSGIIASEFPLFNYMIYLVSVVFDYTHWYGRLINLMVSSIGIYFFYLLMAKIADRKIAFNAAIVLIVSIWFAFSRKTMPDTFSVSLVMIGLYYGYRYLREGNDFRVILYFLLVTFGVLCKIPALSLLAAIPVIFFIEEIPVKRKVRILIMSVISFMIVCLWYFYWVPYLIRTYHYPLYFPKGFVEGMHEIRPLMSLFFKQFYFMAFESFIAFAFFLVGIFSIIKNKNRNLIIGLFLITVTFLIFTIKTGAVFPTHNYYIIPFVPVMAFIAAWGIGKLPSKYQFIPLILIVVEGIGNQQHDFFIKDSERYKLSLENLTNEVVGKDELIVINGGSSPQEIYLAHRKGWTIENGSITESELNGYRNSGAAYLIIDKKSYAQPIPYFPLVHGDSGFDIYKLK
ncbi:MAG: glycosyltransferase family 39 protein [Saprospiraceae bacterium]